MPTSLDPGDILRCRFWCTAGDQAAVNTLYYVIQSTSGSVTTDLNVADDLDALMGPFYKALMPPSATYNGVTVQLKRTPPRSPVFSRNQAGVGTLGADLLPRQTATLVQFRTVDAGRAFRGRIYLPFPPTSAIDADGLPTSAFKVLVAQFTAQLASIGSFDNSLTAPTGFVNTAQVIVHSVPKGGVPPPPIPSAITAWIPGELFATQRRRGSYGRTNMSPV